MKKRAAGKRIYGIIGYPVRHTLSPLMQNAAFRASGIKASYMPFEIRPRDLRYAFLCVKAIGISGLNITIPHKEAAAGYMDDIDGEASMIGAVNTVALTNGRLKGFNTDGAGFVAAFKDKFGVSPKGRKFFIAGAGGAARAISFALALRGARRVLITDKVRKKAARLARSLADETSCEAAAVDRDKKAVRELVLDSDVFINATPCGMKASDEAVIEGEFLREGLFVCDLIYSPSVTRLLRDARKRGSRVMNGMGMLLNQGAASFEIWTGKKAPLEVMRRALYRGRGGGDAD